MNFTIKQLRTFLVVADSQSFSHAAQHLHLTPGAVSLIIKELEQEFGFSLFDRTTRTMVLSKAGEEFRPAAEKVMHEIQSALLTVDTIKNQSTGIVRIAAPLLAASSLLPTALAVYRKHKPDVVVRLIDCSVDDLVDAVASHRVDLAFGADRKTGNKVKRIALYKSPWMMLCAPSNALAISPRITWGALNDHSVITTGRDYETYFTDALQYLTADQQFEPDYVVDNISTALGLATSDLAVMLSLCPGFLAKQARSMGLVMRRIEEPEIIREMSIYVPCDRTLTPAAQAFLEFIQPYLKQQEEAGSIVD
ncbi:LysR family transcriptional regulator [Pseudomonas sp. GR 6-02]|uniref:LysR family transcriptional regulator n=1 Tax=Pseudomonas sp. GR 6-02 TaxID=1659194 RepID=UPI0007E303A7|nr:LysR family transcriptional regulator [Pseudomonas sp. GR 6-02]